MTTALQSHKLINLLIMILLCKYSVMMIIIVTIINTNNYTHTRPKTVFPERLKPDQRISCTLHEVEFEKMHASAIQHGTNIIIYFSCFF